MPATVMAVKRERPCTSAAADDGYITWACADVCMAGRWGAVPGFLPVRFPRPRWLSDSVLDHIEALLPQLRQALAALQCRRGSRSHRPRGVRSPRAASSAAGRGPGAASGCRWRRARFRSRLIAWPRGLVRRVRKALRESRFRKAGRWPPVRSERYGETSGSRSSLSLSTGTEHWEQRPHADEPGRRQDSQDSCTTDGSGS